MKTLCQTCKKKKKNLQKDPLTPNSALFLCLVQAERVKQTSILLHQEDISSWHILQASDICLK